MDHGQALEELLPSLPAGFFDRILRDIPADAWIPMFKDIPTLREAVLEGFSTRPDKLPRLLVQPKVQARLRRILQSGGPPLEEVLNVWGLENLSIVAFLEMLDREFLLENRESIKNLIGPERMVARPLSPGAAAGVGISRTYRRILLGTFRRGGDTGTARPFRAGPERPGGGFPRGSPVAGRYSDRSRSRRRSGTTGASSPGRRAPEEDRAEAGEDPGGTGQIAGRDHPVPQGERRTPEEAHRYGTGNRAACGGSRRPVARAVAHPVSTGGCTPVRRCRKEPGIPVEAGGARLSNSKSRRTNSTAWSPSSAGNCSR